MLFVFNSCGKDQEQPAPSIKEECPSNAKAITYTIPPGGCPIYTHWDPILPDEVSYPCEAVSASTLRSSQRNKATTLYGQQGGSAFDQIQSDYYSVSNIVYLSNYSSLVSAYVSQIRNAIINASNAYIASVSSTTNYNASTYLSYLNSYLTPLKTKISNDPNLNIEQKNVLSKAFIAVNDNFHQASSLVTNNLNCFEDPTSSSVDGEVSTQGWLGNVLKKVVNIVATVVVAVVENTVRFAAEFYRVGQTETVMILGGAVGAIWGLYRGIRKAIEGDFVCLFACP
ncbi:hypothetical protein [Pontibacter silvestris]|nr:hypothetical protein [Pontibacter silvestris]